MIPTIPQIAVIILAAGKGTRMKSEKAKVLHEIAGIPMIQYVVDTAAKVAGNKIVIVIGTQADKVKSAVSAHAEVRYAYQEQQLGTGHAVLCALPAVFDHADHVVILCGDVPLIKEQTLARLINDHVSRRNAITILGAYLEDPFGYGRLVQDTQGNVLRIVEEVDASADEKSIRWINTGIYCIKRELLGSLLSMIKTNNAQNEMYLTDIVGLAAAAREPIGMVSCPDSHEMIGINTIGDLERVEAILASSEKP